MFELRIGKRIADAHVQSGTSSISMDAPYLTCNSFASGECESGEVRKIVDHDPVQAIAVPLPF
jgi:hypothetical protein